MIIIFQVFEVSEGIKRTTTSGGDAQQNGAIALYVVEHDLRNAGMGFNDVSYAGCNVLAYDSKRATPDFTMKLVPVSITPGATAKVADQFTVLYGSGALVANPSMLSVNMDSASNGTDPLSLTNPYAFAGRPGRAPGTGQSQELLSHGIDRVQREQCVPAPSKHGLPASGHSYQ